jgi:hypothetical protein
MDIPIFDKKHFLPQSSDIPRHTSKVVEGGDSSDFDGERCVPSFLEGDRSRNILDSNGDRGQ